MSDTSIGLKEKVFDFIVKASNTMSKTSNTSTFLSTGKLTPEEFVAAGDLLVNKCGSWSWASGEESKRVDYLPPDKQYLVTRNVACNPVKSGTTNSEVDDGWLSITKTEEDNEEQIEEVGQSVLDYSDSDDDDSIGDVADAEDFDNEDNIEDTDTAQYSKTIQNTRTYEITICYSKYFQVPHVWLFGYDKNGRPLNASQMFEDISEDHVGQTVTVKTHPHLSVNYASIHPCKHSDVMKKIVENMIKQHKEPRVDQYLVLFLKFLSAVLPSLEYDNTFDLDITMYQE